MKTTPKIEKGIPIVPRGKRGRKTVYPFSDMEVGDSVFYAETGYGLTLAKSASYAHGRAYGKKFATHRGDGGMRIWRVS